MQYTAAMLTSEPTELGDMSTQPVSHFVNSVPGRLVKHLSELFFFAWAVYALPAG